MKSMFAKSSILALFCAGLLACGGDGAEDLITGLSGVWRTILSQVTSPALCGEVFPGSLDIEALAENRISIDGPSVTLIDLSKRTFTGLADSASSFEAAHIDSRSTEIETVSLRVRYENIGLGSASVNARYCYSRPAYGCCSEWSGVAQKIEQ